MIRWKISTMAEEEQTTKCVNTSSSSCGGSGFGIGNIVRSSKKPKPKKVPQRGLGVAQLEKIRLEEQQRKDSAAISPSQSNISPPKSSYLCLPVPNYQPSNQSSSSSIPYPPDLPSPNSIFRPLSSVQNFNMVNSSNSVPLASPVGWSHGSGSVHKMWSSCEYAVEKDNSGIDPGLAFRQSVNLPYESNPIWPLPSLMTRAQQYQQNPSSVVNVSSATSSSSVLNFQSEPPSNQSYYGNYPPMWLEEEKVVGMKRPYPFSLENPPGPSFYCRFPSVVPPVCRSDESAFNRGSVFNFGSGNQNFREGPSCSTSISEPNSRKSVKENVIFNGDFLTLAPPTASSMSSCSKFKQPSISPTNTGYYVGEFPEFESLPYHGKAEQVPQQQPYYSFLLPSPMQIGQAKATMSYFNGGEVGESIDLNLKL